MNRGRSKLAMLVAGGLLAYGGAAGQMGPTRDTAAILTSPTLPPEGREAILSRIEAVHENFRATHRGLGPEQFGAQCCQITQIPSAAFTPFEGGLWSVHALGYSFMPDLGERIVWAPVQLPSGALVSYLDLYFYDVDQYDVSAQLLAHAGGGLLSGAPSELVLASASSSGNSGYGYAVSPLIGHIVNNNVGYDPAAAQLAVKVRAFSTSNPDNVGFKAVDLWWMRQVNPAPATPTFNDVPAGDPAFQFIEALAASGITVGCSASPPLYCPDNPVTRRQMAVFLAKALGLYWPF